MGKEDNILKRQEPTIRSAFPTIISRTLAGI